MKKSILLTGSNLGNRTKYLERALDILSKEAGVILNYSNIYESEPWGFDAKQNFLNQAIELNTNLLPKDLLNKVLEIEQIIGRTRNTSNVFTSREIDIDIIFYDDKIVNEDDLIIPHPYFIQRRFALTPVVEICPLYFHPELKKTVKQLLLECIDKSKVYLYCNNKFLK